jgi:hypothetical protein
VITSRCERGSAGLSAGCMCRNELEIFIFCILVKWKFSYCATCSPHPLWFRLDMILSCSLQDDFNLSGLSSQVPYYDYALDMILDNEISPEVVLTEQQHELLQSAAEMLFGLIHARYIITSRGLATMLEKVMTCDFGKCPRCYCDGK